jgi:hypothetical protein
MSKCETDVQMLKPHSSLFDFGQGRLRYTKENRWNLFHDGSSEMLRLSVCSPAVLD